MIIHFLRKSDCAIIDNKLVIALHYADEFDSCAVYLFVESKFIQGKKKAEIADRCALDETHSGP